MTWNKNPNPAQCHLLIARALPTGGAERILGAVYRGVRQAIKALRFRTATADS